MVKTRRQTAEEEVAAQLIAVEEAPEAELRPKDAAVARLAASAATAEHNNPPECGSTEDLLQTGIDIDVDNYDQRWANPDWAPMPGQPMACDEGYEEDY